VVPRGWYVMARHEVFGERLARLERRSRLRRPHDGPAVGREHVNDSPTEWELGSDHSEIDALAAGEAQELVRVTDIRVQALGDRRDPWVPGRATDGGDVSFARELPGQGVLSRAAADNEDLHEEQANCLPDRKLTDRDRRWMSSQPLVNPSCAELTPGTRLFR